MLNQTLYRERRDDAVNSVLWTLCMTLFFVNVGQDYPEAANRLIGLEYAKVGGRYSEGGEKLRALIEKTERLLGATEPYHIYFADGFLAALSAISTPDVALYLEQSNPFIRRWDAIALQYCIDMVADGMYDPRWKRGPLERAASWARERLAALQPIAPMPETINPKRDESTTMTPGTLRNLYLELLQHPALADELTNYKKSKLREYAKSEALLETRTVVAMMEGTPDYPYPDEYRNGREVEYLLNKHSPAYWDSQRVLKLLAERPIAATQHAETIPTVGAAESKPKATLPIAIPVDFSLYIKEEYRERLIPFLKAEYTGQKPQAVACMLIALQDLGCLKRQLKENETTLHASLTTFLGSVGVRAGLNGNLTKLDRASEKENLKIQAHRNRIKTHMEQA